MAETYLQAKLARAKAEAELAAIKVSELTKAVESEGREKLFADIRCAMERWDAEFSQQIAEGNEARITIVVQEGSDKLSMSATCKGRFDSSYASMPAERLFSTALPRLVEELRSQLQVSSGSTTTE